MRKSVLFLLGVLYLVSVVVVTFFGIQARMDQFKVYITSLEITNKEIVYNKKGDKCVVLNLKPNEGTVSFWIETKIEPSNASNTELEYKIVNGNGMPVSEDFVIVSDKGEVVFKQACFIHLQVNTTDGSGIFEKLLINCRES